MDARLAFGHPRLAPDRLIHGENLDVLGALPPGSLDLIYIDPPFATGSVRRGAAGLEYPDRLGELGAYLTWLAPRLAAMHRSLGPAGSLFVHLDWRAVHYVKVELDRLFGDGRFVNEIVWCYAVGGKSTRSFARKHDSILWFTKSAAYDFFPDAVRIPRRAGSHMKVTRDEEGRPVQVKRDRKTGRIYAYPVHEGKIPEDYWTDIGTLNRSAGERTGWPTQKPEALVTRIIAAASRPGALVADFFCGSGTTAVVAQRLERRFLAVDSSADAVEVCRARLAASGAALARDGRPVPDVELTSVPPTGLPAAGSR